MIPLEKIETLALSAHREAESPSEKSSRRMHCTRVVNRVDAERREV